jgi:hypothetical protein
VIDIDQTLVDTVHSDTHMCPGLENIQKGEFNIVIRPFSRWFLRAAATHCKSVSIWTNGAPEWAQFISNVVFADVPWLVVLDRSHSINMNKALKRMFERDDYPMTPSDTFIIDDNDVTRIINPKNCIKTIKFTATNTLDHEFIKLAVMFGWVKESAGDGLVHNQDMTALCKASYDPKPFGLANQKLWCYFNAVAQCILRVPSIMRKIGVPLVQWFKMIKHTMGEGTQDAGEALIVLIHPILNTPAQVLEGGDMKGDEQSKSKSSVCLMYVQPKGQSTADAVREYFRWAQVDDGEGVNGKRRIRSLWPGGCITCVALVIHRSINTHRVDRSPIVISPCVVTPDDRVFYLRSVVSHTGGANLGHYVGIFIRHNGTAWVADDQNMTMIDSKDKLLASQTKNCAIVFYDECGSFL